jgi:hypothetical protein
MTADIRTKPGILKLLADGEITAGEAAWATGQSRQTIHNWAKAAGIDYYSTRMERVRVLVNDAYVSRAAKQ